MPLNSLLLTCFVHALHFGEAGNQVSIARDPRSDETILLFVTDEQSNARSTLRKDLGMGKSNKICDCIFFYSREGGPENVLCLVELKGNNVADGVEQILSTYDYLKKRFDKSHFNKIVWRAYISVHGSGRMDKPSAAQEQRLKRDFDQFNINRDNDAFQRLLRTR